MRNALNQINKVQPGAYAQDKIDGLAKWNDDVDFPVFVDPGFGEGHSPVHALEQKGVYFSNSVDLDLMMLDAYPVAYEASERESPDEATIVAVLGKSHTHEERLGEDILGLFGDYHSKFDLKSKPATHLQALASLTDEELLANLPEVLGRLVEDVRARLRALPE